MTNRFYPINLLDYLEETAARLPDKTAFADKDDHLTFKQLQDIARRLGPDIARQCPAGSAVGVAVKRDVWTIAAFMGALYAGCYYIPIDTGMPEERRDSILRTISPKILLMRTKEEIPSEQIPVLLKDSVTGDADDKLLAERRESTLDIDPAYGIFTSGSTGTPKGILVSHRSVIDFIEWYVATCGITEEDVLGNQAPFFFDLSVKDIYSVIRTGCTAHILEKKLFTFPLLLVRALKEKKVTVCSWATSAFRLVAMSGALEKETVPTLKKTILGGEMLQAADVNRWKKAMPELQVINLYGPTEVTVDCTCYILDREFADDEAIPIGKACRNMQVMILDENALPVSPGTPGEICVRGSGLALGYAWDGEKTDKSFVRKTGPYGVPDTVYHTGDIGVVRDDGLIYFLSRQDGQIKHMGYRIELGEVESALRRLKMVQEGICFYDENDRKIVAVAQTFASENDLAVALRKSLPKYMIPNRYRIVDRIPYTANGKIDRNKIRKDYDHDKNNG